MFVAVGLAVFGILCGALLAVGEMQAFYVTLSIIVGIAVFLDFRIGAAILIVALLTGASGLLVAATSWQPRRTLRPASVP